MPSQTLEILCSAGEQAGELLWHGTKPFPKVLLSLVLEVAFSPPTIQSIISFMIEIFPIFLLSPPANHCLKVQLMVCILHIGWIFHIRLEDAVYTWFKSCLWLCITNPVESSQRQANLDCSYDDSHFLKI